MLAVYALPLEDQQSAEAPKMAKLHNSIITDEINWQDFTLS